MKDTSLLPLARPLTDGDELEEVRRVLESGHLAQGPKVAEFEQVVADYVGTKYAFATSSATTALHLSLVVLDVGPGDEVLVPDFTFPATANVVEQQGATTVLVDIDLDSFTVNLQDLARKITERTRVIVPVHAFGCAADMDPILELAREHGIPVMEDAATAIGTEYYGRRAGSIGTLNSFSFHPRKVITTGEGGMLTTDNDELAEQIALLRSHGGVRSEGRFLFEAAGFNYRLSDIQAAVGVAQMRKLDGLISSKRALASRMSELLLELDGVKPPSTPRWRGHIFQSYVVLLDDGINRDAVIRAMRGQGIETTLGTYSLHAQPYYMRQYGLRQGDLPNSYRAYQQSLSLPLYPPMGEAEVERVVGALRHAIEQASARVV